MVAGELPDLGGEADAAICRQVVLVQLSIISTSALQPPVGCTVIVHVSLGATLRE